MEMLFSVLMERDWTLVHTEEKTLAFILLAFNSSLRFASACCKEFISDCRLVKSIPAEGAHE